MLHVQFAAQSPQIQVQWNWNIVRVRPYLFSRQRGTDSCSVSQSISSEIADNGVEIRNLCLTWLKRPLPVGICSTNSMIYLFVECARKITTKSPCTNAPSTAAAKLNSNNGKMTKEIKLPKATIQILPRNTAHVSAVVMSARAQTEKKKRSDRWHETCHAMCYLSPFVSLSFFTFFIHYVHSTSSFATYFAYQSQS